MAWPTPATPVTPCVEWTQPSGTPSPLLDAAQFYTAARRNAGACPCGPVIARLRHMTVRAPLALRAETTPYVSPQLKTVNREGRCVEVLSLLKYENRSSHFQPSNINSNYIACTRHAHRAPPQMTLLEPPYRGARTAGRAAVQVVRVAIDQELPPAREVRPRTVLLGDAERLPPAFGSG